MLALSRAAPPAHSSSNVLGARVWATCVLRPGTASPGLQGSCVSGLPAQAQWEFRLRQLDKFTLARRSIANWGYFCSHQNLAGLTGTDWEGRHFHNPLIPQPRAIRHPSAMPSSDA